MEARYRLWGALGAEEQDAIPANRAALQALDEAVALLHDSPNVLAGMARAELQQEHLLVVPAL